MLLGVLPVHTTSTEFVWSQRVEQFRESARALGVTRRISPATPSSIKITAVWLLERNCLKVGELANISHLKLCLGLRPFDGDI